MECFCFLMVDCWWVIVGECWLLLGYFDGDWVGSWGLKVARKRSEACNSPTVRERPEKDCFCDGGFVVFC